MGCGNLDGAGSDIAVECSARGLPKPYHRQVSHRRVASVILRAPSRLVNPPFNPEAQAGGMDPTQIGLFDLAERRLAWADRRQELLAQNIANANTPGYRPHDLQPFAATLTSAARSLRRLAPSRTICPALLGPASKTRPSRAQLPAHRMATRSRSMSSW